MPIFRFFSLLLIVAILLTGCMTTNVRPQATAAPATMQLPEKVKIENGKAYIKVYEISKKSVGEMELEAYVMGVLAGEMPNDWPIEALKAQAILARTFVMKFIAEKASRYDDADISTDIREAQAYDYAAINDNIRTAVNQTAGKVLSYNGQFPYAWFSSHAGGWTARAVDALSYDKPEPGYTKNIDSREAEEEVFTVEFTAAQVAKAAAAQNVTIAAPLLSASIGENTPSKRAKMLIINGKTLSAAEFRIEIGSNKLRSTYITDISVEKGMLKISGRGYGHGVGMSQYGARALADEGMKAEAIVEYYFNGCSVVRLNTQ